MSAPVDFHSQIASIMEVLANAAVAEICKVVDDGYAMVHLEMSRSQKENEFLRRKIQLMELQVARYRAERVKGAEGSIISRFPGVRLLNRQNRESPTGPSLQGKTRSRGPGVRHSVQKSGSINLDQDPDQDVVTTTKTESADSEEEGELLIVKVEGALETADTQHKAPLDTSITTGEDFSTDTLVAIGSKNNSNSGPARRRSITEGQGRLKNTSSLLSQEEMMDNVQGDSSEKDSGASSITQTCITSPPDNFTAQSLLHTASSSQKQDSRSTQPQQQSCLPYACTFCSRHFTHRCQLRIHERAHTGEKPYHCAHCGKSFGQFCSLKRHQMVHTGERPFPCPHCGKQFSTSTNLKVHQSVHRGERRFHCSKCGKNFSFLSNLIRHRALHTAR